MEQFTLFNKIFNTLGTRLAVQKVQQLPIGLLNGRKSGPDRVGGVAMIGDFGQYMASVFKVGLQI